MLTAIALPYSALPLALIELHGLDRLAQERGGATGRYAAVSTAGPTSGGPETARTPVPRLLFDLVLEGVGGLAFAGLELRGPGRSPCPARAGAEGRADVRLGRSRHPEGFDVLGDLPRLQAGL